MQNKAPQILHTNDSMRWYNEHTRLPNNNFFKSQLRENLWKRQTNFININKRRVYWFVELGQQRYISVWKRSLFHLVSNLYWLTKHWISPLARNWNNKLVLRYIYIHHYNQSRDEQSICSKSWTTSWISSVCFERKWNKYPQHNGKKNYNNYITRWKTTRFFKLLGNQDFLWAITIL